MNAARAFALSLFLLPVAASDAAPISDPGNRTLTVAFVVTEGANVMDIAGPWETFQDVEVPSRGLFGAEPFRLIVVSNSALPVRLTGGMTIVPDYTFENAPDTDIVVVGAQKGSDGLVDWLRARHAQGDVVMSVCTGAFKLAATGLLDGKRATTHHDFADDFAKTFPTVTLERGDRFVQSDERLFTAGGLTSGIDLALYLVGLYFGKDVAAKTAEYMEHTGTGWINPDGASPM